MKLPTKLALPLAAAFGLLTVMAFASPAEAGRGKRGKRYQRVSNHSSTQNYRNTRSGYDWVVRSNGSGYWRRASSRPYTYNSHRSYTSQSSYDTGSRSHNRTHRMFDRLDDNYDGYISWDEGHHSRLLSRKFHRIDRNDDGYVSRRELRRYFRRVERRNSRYDHHSY
jgi:predicted outer membrane lipoprotein